ncbi:unnamed protein product [Periconia digitata]|uniref:FAD-binding PCMH-type domain-containing protein n=1 Tax=Periconia digitata TaxID=1303443 RepID=A0A9W4XV67_9PLEO|nr:unnamed protein product [Periconia digitata]
MSVIKALELFRKELGSEIEILADQHNGAFIEYAKRWTDIGRKTPAAIVVPSSEIQIQKTVKWAVENSVPFVTKSGGHSEWSTIDSSGIIIDLSKYSSIEVNAAEQKATLRGSILAKQVSVALAEVGLFTALGNGNPIGAIPYFLNGGASVVTSCVGYGSDQILSARMIDARGNLIEVTDSEKDMADLLWALRGAGQFFGLITELTVKAYPFSALGNDQGVIWTGVFILPLERAGEVAEAMNIVANDSTHPTSGLMMIMAPPPKNDPALVISARYRGNPENAAQAYKPLYDLNPLMANGAPVPIQNTSDGHEAFNEKGTFKRFATTCLPHFNATAIPDVVQLWKTMVTECPDAITTSFNFQWDSRLAPVPAHAPSSCSSLRDTRLWQNNFIWHTDVNSRNKVDEFSDRAIAAMRGDGERREFQNATREGPIELRYRDPVKLAKLKQLKQVWDPNGVYTRQLLDG